MTLVTSVWLHCDVPSCEATGPKVVGPRSDRALALLRAKDHGWKRRRLSYTTAQFDLCPDHADIDLRSLA